MVCLFEHIVSPEQYLKYNGYTDYNEVETVADLQDYLMDVGIWDYPMEEIGHIVDTHRDDEITVMLVTDGTVYQWFET